MNKKEENNNKIIYIKMIHFCALLWKKAYSKVECTSSVLSWRPISAAMREQ
jgi:hypothetical protein